MSTDKAKLLRRPLPPKKVPPIIGPLPPCTLSGTVVESMPSVRRTGKSSATKWSENSYQMSLSGDDDLTFRVPPASAQTTAPSMLLSKMSEGFPCRPPRTLPKIPLLDLLQTDRRYKPSPPSFCFNDFLRIQNGGGAAQSPEGLEEAVLSRCNYRKLVDLFLAELHRSRQTEVWKQLMSCDAAQEPKRRAPWRQVMCELTALIHMEVQITSGQTGLVSMASRCEQKQVEVWSPEERQAIQATEVILNSVTTKHFQGSRRTTSPFSQGGAGGAMSPSELAILDCLSEGGKALSLKAHFMAVLPDVSQLAHCLVYLNLSFNDFRVFPVEVYELTRLETLKMRDNPIEDIPSGLHRLFRLKIFIISFCKISSLPAELYQLPCLQCLDVSYNFLSSLSSDIHNLRALEHLNVEGNQLPGLPCGALSLPISQLNITNNYMHRVFTRSYSRTSPQTLGHLSTHALSLALAGLHHASLPTEAQLALSRAGVCDCCHGRLFGPGLRIIRPCQNMFGLRRVPFIFYACTPTCYSNFRNQTDNLSSLLYGEEA
ncbi:uncharacterized protein LOC124485137 [Hypomesus transpacificus]|uniref:uncharacterized protein LOC124485137 n=1 Tax=Hypomesus transpacificus TaxID=137520 RepID=UPI001F076B38|nr:uncharacterized protein LOC124485137 [Hypomesus transpacificus]